MSGLNKETKTQAKKMEEMLSKKKELLEASGVAREEVINRAEAMSLEEKKLTLRHMPLELLHNEIGARMQNDKELRKNMRNALIQYEAFYDRGIEDGEDR